MPKKVNQSKTRPHFEIPKAPKKNYWKMVTENNGLIWIIITVAIVTLVAWGIKNPPKAETEKKDDSKMAAQISKLPQGWSRTSAPLEKGISDRLEKKIDNGIKPIVVLIKSNTSNTNLKEYVDSLIGGLQSAIPSLVVENNTDLEKDGFYIRHLDGYYYSGQDQITIQQEIYIKDGQVWTITGSYEGNDPKITKEIDSVFTYLYESKIR